MNKKYKTLSEKHKIKDKNMAKIIDYFERHTSGDFIKTFKNLNVEIGFEFTKDLSLYFTKSGRACFYSNEHYYEFGSIPIEIMAANIAGIYQGTKALLDKRNKKYG